MPAGCPRTVSLSPDEMISLGKEMVKWCLENQESILHLSDWYTISKGFTYNEWKAFIQLKEFLPYYEQALKIVGRKYLDKDSNVRNGISERWMRVYYKDLVEQEDADVKQKRIDELEMKKLLIEYELKLKSDALDTVPEEIKQQYHSLISQISALQSTRKRDSTNKSTDNKS